MFSEGLRRMRWFVFSLWLPAMMVLPARAAEVDDLIKLQDQVYALQQAGKYAQAIPIAQQVIARAERVYKNDPSSLASCLDALASLYCDLNRYAEAEPLYKRSLTVVEKGLGADHPDVADSLNNLGNLYYDQSRYAEAEPFYQRALKIWEKALGAEDPDLGLILDNLAGLYHDQGRYAEAEPFYKRALAIREKGLGGDHADVAKSVNNVATLYHTQARYAEAEPLYKRALAIREKSLEADDPDLAQTLNDLAALYDDLGRYSEAEPLYKRGLAIREKALGSEDSAVAQSVNSLAGLYLNQGRYAEAEPLFKRALAIGEKVFGADHPNVADYINNLALAYEDQERYADAEPLHKRALAIREKALGVEHADVAQSVNNLAVLYYNQEHYAESECFFERALAIREKALGAEHPFVAQTLIDQATLRWSQEKHAEAEPLVDRAIGICERAGVSPGGRYSCYLLRARLAWKLDRPGEALADLRLAMQLAEQQRGQFSGGEQERAKGFSHYTSAFEQMVAWQVDVQDAGEALSAIERSHARSLLDEMGTSGADLDAGRSPTEREQLRQKESELKMRIAALERELKSAPADKQKKLEADLAEARRQLYEFVRDMRTSSPVYRNLLSTSAGPLRVSQVQRQLAADNGLILVYLVGEEGGYVLAIDSKRTRLTALSIDDKEAATLGVEAGPLTAPRLHKIMLAEKSGLTIQLADPKRAELASPRLAALWKVLIPESYHEALAAGDIKRLLVVPDGPLALLPFEALVVASGDQTRYLLDVGPPIAYAPSATVLYNLVERRSAGIAAPGREPVLTVGNPNYVTRVGKVASDKALDTLTARSQFNARGGDLAPLPFSGQESVWVRDVFRERGQTALMLQQATATEAQVRAALPGRKIVHLACHGLVDQSYGNFFGALALTMRNDTQNPADDGFLTLAEIYGLNLKSCELAILSACETNFGPQQQGEGTWALSRGFLVAGSRRVVASNWLVDDEAAASLVSYYCAGLAQSVKQGAVTDYAKTLQAAKRWVRNQEKWQSPYYWGTFVLVGPN